jgi:hypothetical protein
MGSIIAYDVLTHMLPKSRIHTFVTIGSPLGMPIVISKIVTEQKKQLIKIEKVRTPENVDRPTKSRTLLGETPAPKEMLMIITDDLSEIRVYEKDAIESLRFYSIKRIEE